MIGTAIGLLLWALFCGGCGVSTSGEGLLGGAESPQAYIQLKQEILSERDSLALRYVQTGDAAVLASAKLLLRQRLEEDLIPSWYGTVWDYNGTSEVPREGMIACGYFVSTLLRDAGFKLERYRLAQQASLHIVQSLAPKEFRWDWSHISLEELKKRMAKLETGFYVVGMDNHVGLLFLDESKELWFMHSSFLDPGTVVRELATESAALGISNRYVIGYLETDWLLGKWLGKEKVVTVGA